MRRADRLADVAGAWREDLEHGRAAPPEQVISEHPEIAAGLQDHFAAQALVQQYYRQRDAWSRRTPEVLGEHHILREVGRGAMGVVYAARQASMQREVALKVLFPTIASTEVLRKRFEREARATGQLHHTNVVTVHHMGVEGDYLYFVMELVRGRPLDEVIAALRDGQPEEDDREPSIDSLLPRFRGRRKYRFVAQAVAGIADALQHAHDQGIVHRDVKPSNLMLDADGVFKLTDFGLAHVAGEGLDMTATGALLGTPLYMSPEQVRARQEDVDHRTDVYSLGATLYEVLTLERPHQGQDVGTLCTQILRDPPVPLRQVAPRVPRDLATIVAKAMEKQPGDRYASAADLARDLRAFADGLPIRARPVGPVRREWRRIKRHPVRAALTAGLVLVGLAAFLFAREAKHEGAERREAQYDLLLRRAVLARAQDDRSQGLGMPPIEAVQLYAQAIGIDPDRRDAYVGRALVDGASLSQRLADVEAARQRGLPEASALALRAYVLRCAGRWEEAADLDPGDAIEPGDVLGALLNGMNASLEQDYARSLPAYAQVIKGAQPRDLLADLARRHRAIDLMNCGQYTEVLSDLQALQASGSTGPQLALYEALAWKRLGKDGEAEGRIMRILGEELRTEEAHIVLAESCERLRLQEWLERVVRQGIRRYPHSAPLWAFGGWAALGRAAQRDGIEAFSKAIELDGNVARFRAWRALAYADTGQKVEALADIARAVTLDGQDPVVLLAAGRVHLAAGEPEKAEAFARRAVAGDPRLDVAHTLRAQVLRKQGKPADALAVMRQVERRAPNSAYIQAELGLVLQDLKRLGDAHAAFSRAASLEPTNSQYQYYVGLILAHLEQPEAALIPLREAVRLRNDNDHAWYQLGYSLGTLGRWDEAEAAYRKLLEIAPSHRGARLEIGSCCRATGRLDEALAVYRAVLEDDDRDLVALQSIAGVLSDQGKFKESKKIFGSVLALAPKSAVAHFNLGILLKRMQDLDAALRSFEQAAELDPKDPAAHLQRTGILIGMGDERGARKALADAEKIPINSAGTHFNLAVARFQLGDSAEAAKAAQRAIEVEPRMAQAHGLLAHAKFRLGDREEAIRSWLHAGTLQPTRFQWVQNAAYGMTQVGRWREAIDLLDGAAARFPQEAEASSLLAWLLASAPDAGARQPTKAVGHARKAVKLAPGNPRHHLVLGAALYRAERYGEAIEELERARALGDDGEFVSFFLAMALHRSGKPEEARKRFDHGAGLRAPDETVDTGSGLTYAEAAKLLGIDISPSQSGR